MLYGVKLNGKIMGGMDSSQKDYVQAIIQVLKSVEIVHGKLELCAFETREIPLKRADAVFKKAKAEERAAAKKREAGWKRMMKKPSKKPLVMRGSLDLGR
jgi:hypothetical protein